MYEKSLSTYISVSDKHLYYRTVVTNLRDVIRNIKFIKQIKNLHCNFNNETLFLKIVTGLQKLKVFPIVPYVCQMKCPEPAVA